MCNQPPSTRQCAAPLQKHAEPQEQQQQSDPFAATTGRSIVETPLAGSWKVDPALSSAFPRNAAYSVSPPRSPCPASGLLKCPCACPFNNTPSDQPVHSIKPSNTANPDRSSPTKPVFEHPDPPPTTPLSAHSLRPARFDLAWPTRTTTLAHEGSSQTMADSPRVGHTDSIASQDSGSKTNDKKKSRRPASECNVTKRGCPTGGRENEHPSHGQRGGRLRLWTICMAYLWDSTLTVASPTNRHGLPAAAVESMAVSWRILRALSLALS